MMKINLWRIFPLLGVLFFAACSDDDETPGERQVEIDNELVRQYVDDNQLDAELDATGFYTVPINTKPSGQLVEKGDIISFRYKISLLDGTVVEDRSGSTAIASKAMHNVYGGIDGYPRGLFPAGIDLGMAYMREGEKYLFIIPSYLAFFDGSRSGVFPAYSNLLAEIEILNIIAEEDQELIEEDSINAYIEREGLAEVQKLSSGLHYIKKEEGSGAKPAKGNVVSVKYTARFLDGTVFDRSESNSPFRFTLGQNLVIKGWEEGIALMDEGEKATLIIPSHLAYSQSMLVIPEKISGVEIPPFSVLVFDVELVDIQ